MTGFEGILFALLFTATPEAADQATQVAPVDVRPMTHREAQKKRLERWSDKIMTCKTILVGSSGISQKVCATNRDWAFEQLAVTTSIKGLKPADGGLVKSE